jgi:hypothetical protein
VTASCGPPNGMSGELPASGPSVAVSTSVGEEAVT